MKNPQAPEPFTRTAAHPSITGSRYRQDYMSLNADVRQPQVKATIQSVRPTLEFPLFGDIVCKRLITAATLEALEEMKISLDGSNVELQGWVERYARNAGFAGWTVPTGLFARLTLRLRCFVRITRLVANETFP